MRKKFLDNYIMVSQLKNKLKKNFAWTTTISIDEKKVKLPQKLNIEKRGKSTSNFEKSQTFLVDILKPIHQQY